MQVNFWYADPLPIVYLTFCGACVAPHPSPKNPNMSAIFGYNPPVIAWKYATPWVWDSQFLQPNTKQDAGFLTREVSRTLNRLVCIDPSTIELSEYIHQHTHTYIYTRILYMHTIYIFSFFSILFSFIFFLSVCFFAYQSVDPCIQQSICPSFMLVLYILVISRNWKLVQGLPSHLGRENSWFQPQFVP